VNFETAYLNRRFTIMSLQSAVIGEIPQGTLSIAKAAFPNGNLCLKMRDELGSIRSWRPTTLIV
jgi:hypothetical protein